MSLFQIYTFVTENTIYEDIVNQYLLSSAKKRNIKVQVLKAPNYRNWWMNVAQKPLMILKLLNEGKDNILFLDADATIESFPSLFDNIPDDIDVAYHTLHWNTWYNRPNDTTTELLSGTLFLRNRPEVKRLCTEWYEKAKDGGVWEQQILEQVIKKYNLKIYDLPLNYCFINTLPGDKEPYVKCHNVIIRHHQVSRNIKRGGVL